MGTRGLQDADSPIWKHSKLTPERNNRLPEGLHGHGLGRTCCTAALPAAGTRGHTSVGGQPTQHALTAINQTVLRETHELHSAPTKCLLIKPFLFEVHLNLPFIKLPFSLINHSLSKLFQMQTQRSTRQLHCFILLRLELWKAKEQELPPAFQLLPPG